MSSLLQPFHPGSIFVATRKGRQFFSMWQVVLPPGTQLTISVAPAADLTWVLVMNSISPARDVITGNIVASPLIYSDIEHSMITHTRIYDFESYYANTWPADLHISVGDPVVHTIVNGSAFTVAIDATWGIMEIPNRAYKEYMELWNGLENILKFMGKFSADDIDLFAKTVKDSIPAVKQKEKKYLEE